jgi:hypothetical protein
MKQGTRSHLTSRFFGLIGIDKVLMKRAFKDGNFAAWHSHYLLKKDKKHHRLYSFSQKLATYQDR